MPHYPLIRLVRWCWWRHRIADTYRQIRYRVYVARRRRVESEGRK